MNQKAVVWGIAAVVVVGLAIAWPKVSSVFKASEANWPAKDITIVVPYNPGGGTDLTTRAVADEMGKALGKNISVVNTPGASGSVGTLNVQNAPHDGYTIMGNGFMSFVSYPVMGYTEKTHRDWHMWIAAFSPNVISVKADSKYKDVKELIKGIKDNPGSVSFGTAGIGTGGHIASEVLKSSLGFNYKHVPYQGGNPAIIAAIAGEVDAVPQLSMEMVDMFRGKKLKGLAALTDKPLVIEGADPIPSIAELVPEMKPSVPLGEAFGIAVPKDTPEAVVKKIDEAFKKAIASESIKKFAKEKGVEILGYSGDESQKYVEKLASTVDWALFDGGVAKISPEKFNIKKPAK
ncbi:MULTISPECIES: Bug family tripartite tricarboxylate transporter substrate binding protein [unclassified Paenibacillus]|uniref:Bug family tripartite tricarboxylate transporter substrate binding protein n=1 Tax=unclassified Paenibacillus TaxID=185978 RepID=UPI0036296050